MKNWRTGRQIHPVLVFSVCFSGLALLVQTYRVAEHRALDPLTELVQTSRVAEHRVLDPLADIQVEDAGLEQGGTPSEPKGFVGRLERAAFPGHCQSTGSQGQMIP